jgi:hypothetical protein
MTFSRGAVPGIVTCIVTTPSNGVWANSEGERAARLVRTSET